MSDVESIRSDNLFHKYIGYAWTRQKSEADEEKIADDQSLPAGSSTVSLSTAAALVLLSRDHTQYNEPIEVESNESYSWEAKMTAKDHWGSESAQVRAAASMLVGPRLAHRLGQLWLYFEGDSNSNANSKEMITPSTLQALLRRYRDWEHAGDFRAEAVQALGGKEGMACLHDAGPGRMFVGFAAGSDFVLAGSGYRAAFLNGMPGQRFLWRPAATALAMVQGTAAVTKETLKDSSETAASSGVGAESADMTESSGRSRRPDGLDEGARELMAQDPSLVSVGGGLLHGADAVASLCAEAVCRGLVGELGSGHGSQPTKDEEGQGEGKGEGEGEGACSGPTASAGGGGSGAPQSEPGAARGVPSTDVRLVGGGTARVVSMVKHRGSEELLRGRRYPPSRGSGARLDWFGGMGAQGIAVPHMASAVDVCPDWLRDTRALDVQQHPGGILLDAHPPSASGAGYGSPVREGKKNRRRRNAPGRGAPVRKTQHSGAATSDTAVGQKVAHYRAPPPGIIGHGLVVGDIVYPKDQRKGRSQPLLHEAAKQPVGNVWELLGLIGGGQGYPADSGSTATGKPSIRPAEYTAGSATSAAVAAATSIRAQTTVEGSHDSQDAIGVRTCSSIAQRSAFALLSKPNPRVFAECSARGLNADPAGYEGVGLDRLEDEVFWGTAQPRHQGAEHGGSKHVRTSAKIYCEAAVHASAMSEEAVVPPNVGTLGAASLFARVDYYESVKRSASRAEPNRYWDVHRREQQTSPWYGSLVSKLRRAKKTEWMCSPSSGWYPVGRKIRIGGFSSGLTGKYHREESMLEMLAYPVPRGMAPILKLDSSLGAIGCTASRPDGSVSAASRADGGDILPDRSMLLAGVDLGFEKPPPRILRRPALDKPKAVPAVRQTFSAAAKHLRGKLADRFYRRWLGRVNAMSSDEAVPTVQIGTAESAKKSEPPQSPDTKSAASSVKRPRIRRIGWRHAVRSPGYFSGLSPIHEACLAKNPVACKHLLASGLADPSLVDNASLPMLYHAVASGSPACVTLLLQAGANPSVSTTTNMSPLSAAVEGSQPDMVAAMLREGVDPQFQTKHGMVAMHHARSPYLAGLLLAAGASVEHRNEAGWTALLAAAYLGDFATCDFLLQSGASPDSENCRGETPLMLAAAVGAVETVRILARAGADLNACSRNGLTPLHCAGLLHDPSCFIVLFSLGATIGCRHHCVSCSNRLESVCHLVGERDAAFLPPAALEKRNMLLRASAVRIHRQQSEQSKRSVDSAAVLGEDAHRSVHGRDSPVEADDSPDECSNKAMRALDLEQLMGAQAPDRSQSAGHQVPGEREDASLRCIPTSPLASKSSSWADPSMERALAEVHADLARRSARKEKRSGGGLGKGLAGAPSHPTLEAAASMREASPARDVAVSTGLSIGLGGFMKIGGGLMGRASASDEDGIGGSSGPIPSDHDAVKSAMGSQAQILGSTVAERGSSTGTSSYSLADPDDARHHVLLDRIPDQLMGPASPTAQTSAEEIAGGARGVLRARGRDRSRAPAGVVAANLGSQSNSLLGILPDYPADTGGALALHSSSEFNADAGYLQVLPPAHDSRTGDSHG